MRLALFEPDIPQNCGTILRLAACLGVAVDIIEPCGFLWDDRRLRRAGMDYLAGAEIARHESWASAIERDPRAARAGLLLLTTQGRRGSHHRFMPIEADDTSSSSGRKIGGRAGRGA